MMKMITVVALSILAGCCRPEANPLPQRSNFATDTDFLRARIAYYTEEWIGEHPDKPWHYNPGPDLWEMGDGIWGMETGPARIAGPGLLVTVDDSGSLIEIKEIFNPE